MIETLSQPALPAALRISSNVADTAADRQRHEDLLGRAPDDVEHDVSLFVAGGDIEKNEFVGALPLVPGGYLDGVARIAEVHEIRPLHDATTVHVQTGNHTFGQHRTRTQ